MITGIIGGIIGHLGIDASMSNTNAGNLKGAVIRDSISAFGQSRSPIRMRVVININWPTALYRLAMVLFVRWGAGVAQSTLRA